jgi:orotate phosphoribosyltransferase
MTLSVSDLLSAAGPQVLQNAHVRRRELAADIVASAYLRGEYVLSSGARSDFYFDKYLFETKPTVLRRLASVLAERVPSVTERLAGPELGAVTLSAAVSLETGLPFVIVRKSAKGYGTGASIEGELHAGERVLLLEDVVSTGGEALAAARKLRAAGAEVIGVLAVIDRQQGGAEALAAEGLSFDALYELDELLQRPKGDQ